MPPLFGLQLHVFVGTREPRLLHARPHAAHGGELPARREHHLVLSELLDLLEHRLAPLAVHLDRLVAKEPGDVGIAAVGVGAAAADEGVDARLHDAERAAAALDDAPQLLLAVALEERRPLERADPRPD